MLVILTHGKQRQEDHKFQANLSFIARQMNNGRIWDRGNRGQRQRETGGYLAGFEDRRSKE